MNIVNVNLLEQAADGRAQEPLLLLLCKDPSSTDVLVTYLTAPDAMTGYNHTDLGPTLEGWLECIPLQEREDSRANFLRAVEQEENAVISHPLLRKDGASLAVQVCLQTPPSSPGSRLAAITPVMTNAGEAKSQTESEIFPSLGKFARHIMHELRNPLNAMLVTLEVMKLQTESDPTLRGYYARLERQIQKLNASVSDLRDFRLPATPPPTSPCKVSSLLSGCLHQSIPSTPSETQGPGVRLDLSDSVQDAVVPLARESIRFVVGELLENALEHCQPEGVVAIQADLDESQLTITVNDQGPGVPSDQHARIFEPFFTSQAGMRRGLGLSAARYQARLMGGELTLVPEPEEEGASFRITLPVSSQATEQPA